MRQCTNTHQVERILRGFLHGPQADLQRRGGVRGHSWDAFPLRVGRRGGAPALQRRGDSASAAARGSGEAPPRARALPRLAFWAATNLDVSFDRGTSLLSLAPGPADSGCSLPGDPRRAPESIQPGCAMQAGWPPCGSPHGRDKVPLCSALWLALSRTLLLSAFFFFFFLISQKSCSCVELGP